MTIRVTHWLVTAATLAVGACVSAPPSQRAHDVVALPDRFDDVPAQTFGVCTDLGVSELPALNDRLHAQNFELRAALARVDRAQALAGQTAAPLWPRLDAAVSGTRGNTTGAQFNFAGAEPATTDLWQGAVTLSYEADLWGRVRMGAQATALDAAAQAAVYRVSELGLAASLAQNYLALIAQQQLLDLLDTQRASSARHLELTRLRFAKGQGAAQDIARQRQQLASLDARVESVAFAQVALAGEVATLLGESVEDAMRRAGSSLPPAPSIADPGVPSNLVSARPDVGAAYARLAAADLRRATALRNRLPKINLTASVLSVETLLADVFTDALWQLGAEVVTPLFDHGARAHERAAARAAADEALHNYAQSLLGAFNEVVAVLRQSRHVDAFAASVDAQLTDAANVLTLTRDAYRLGAGDYLNVLTALQSLQALEQQRVDARLQQFNHRIALCRALGHEIGRATAPTKDEHNE